MIGVSEERGVIRTRENDFDLTSLLDSTSFMAVQRQESKGSGGCACYKRL